MGPINSLWFKWKGLKLPWRKSFLAGSDLAGNTFWEFKDAVNVGRFRRIVKYNPKTHLADVKVSPQWHQWLRYVRQDAPTIQEQQNDLLRQERMKYLARIADERWASKPSYLDRPQEQQPGPATQSHDSAHHPEPGLQHEKGGVRSAIGTEAELEREGKKKKKTPNPWRDKEPANPGEKWQPESWTPPSSPR